MNIFYGSFKKWFTILRTERHFKNKSVKIINCGSSFSTNSFIIKEQSLRSFWPFQQNLIFLPMCFSCFKFFILILIKNQTLFFFKNISISIYTFVRKKTEHIVYHITFLMELNYPLNNGFIELVTNIWRKTHSLKAIIENVHFILIVGTQ